MGNSIDSKGTAYLHRGLQDCTHKMFAAAHSPSVCKCCSLPSPTTSQLELWWQFFCPQWNKLLHSNYIGKLSSLPRCEIIRQTQTLCTYIWCCHYARQTAILSCVHGKIITCTSTPVGGSESPSQHENEGSELHSLNLCRIWCETPKLKTVQSTETSALSFWEVSFICPSPKCDN